MSHTTSAMSPKHPEIAVAADSDLEAARNRQVAAESLFEAMDDGRFDLDLAAVDRLNALSAD